MSTQDKVMDRAIAKAARSAIVNCPLDITEMNIFCQGGYIELQGKVRAGRGQLHINLKKEVQNMVTIIRSVRGVRDCFANRLIMIEMT